MTSSKYDALAEKAERGQLRPIASTIKRGASASATDLLLEATGASGPEEITKLAVGRPPVGAERGPSPTVRARVPRALKDRVVTLSNVQARKESDIVHSAVSAYMDAQDALRQADTATTKAIRLLRAAGMSADEIASILATPAQAAAATHEAQK